MLGMLVRRSFLVLTALLLASFVACAAPTLPLPPPSALVEGPPDADSMVRISGSARESVFVFCLNERTEQGVITRSDESGAYTLQIRAEVDDTLTLWQAEDGSSGGMPIQVVVPSD